MTSARDRRELVEPDFRASEDAVSPVIGVILMVAITVVLAAVVFVLVSNLTKNSNDGPPHVSFSRSGSGNNTILTVVSSDSSFIPWTSFSSSTSPPTCLAAVPTSGNVTAGQQISFSGTGCNGATFNLVYSSANSIAYTTVLA